MPDATIRAGYERVKKLAKRDEKNQEYLDSVLARLGVETVPKLNIEQASRLIEAMKNGGGRA